MTSNVRVVRVIEGLTIFITEEATTGTSEITETPEEVRLLCFVNFTVTVTVILAYSKENRY